MDDLPESGIQRLRDSNRREMQKVALELNF